MKRELIISSEKLNLNNRIYPIGVIKKIIEDFNDDETPMYGELGYPDNFDISLSKSSHIIEKMYHKNHKLPRKKKKKYKKLGIYNDWIKNNSSLIGEIRILDTKEGKILQNTFSHGVFRPRGFGSVNEDGVITMNKLMTFDFIPNEDDSFKEIKKEK